MLNDKDKMHPQDIRNLLIFGVISIALWSMYEIYVIKPKKEAIEQRAQIEKMIAQKEAETGIEIVQKPIVLPRTEVLTKAERVKIDNDVIFGSLNLQGARLDDMALREHFKELDKKENVEVLSPKDTEYPRYFEHGWVAKGSSNLRLPNNESRWSIQGENKVLGIDKPVIIVWDNGQGLRFERKYSIDDRYMMTLEQKVVNRTGANVALFPYGLISQTGLPEDLSKRWILHEGPIGYVGDSLIQITYKDLKKEQNREASAAQGWAGITDKYWISTLIPEQGKEAQYRFRHMPNIKDDKKGRYQADFTGSEVDIAAGATASVTSHIYVGAKEVLVLEDYEKNLGIIHFDLAVDFGWFWFITKPFFFALHYLHQLIGNMGLSIICLTIVIRMLTYPLTSTSFRSFAKMKKVNPQIVELRAKYGDDKAKLQEEIIALYTREGVNPMSGCIPMFVQIPIFFSLYKVFFVTIEMRHAPFFGWIQDLSAPDPTNLFTLFGLIPWDPVFNLHIGVWPLMMMLIMLVQKKLNPPPTDNIQRGMMNVFPFFIGFMMAGFASGLVIYWTFSGLISMLQQMYIMRSLGVPIYLFGQEDHDQEVIEATRKGPAVHPLAEMAEEEVEAAMFGKEEEPVTVSAPKPKKSKKKKK